MTKIATHTMCQVVLTDFGAEVYNVFAHEWNGLVPARDMMPLLKAGDTIRAPLSRIAHIFGPGMGTGSPPVFEDDALKMEIPDE